MQTVEVNLPKGIDGRLAERIVERICAEEGLSRTVKTTLKSYPGSRHHHYRKGREPGTIEITIWPTGRKILLSIHENRTGSWTKDCIERLTEALRSALE